MGCIKVGICAYCGEPRNVDTEESAAQSQVDKLATEQCGCVDAHLARRKREQREACRKNIREIIAGEEPEAACILEASIVPVQEKKFKALTIDTGCGRKTRIRDTKDGLKVGLEEKKKDEALA